MEHPRRPRLKTARRMNFTPNRALASNSETTSILAALLHFEVPPATGVEGGSR
jgi:hypothetical protein